jgi:hypothetical protein
MGWVDVMLELELAMGRRFSRKKTMVDRRKLEESGRVWTTAGCVLLPFELRRIKRVDLPSSFSLVQQARSLGVVAGEESGSKTLR